MQFAVALVERFGVPHVWNGPVKHVFQEQPLALLQRAPVIALALLALRLDLRRQARETHAHAHAHARAPREGGGEGGREREIRTFA